MATIASLRERTISFFEVVEEKAGEQHRTQQFPWDAALAQLSKAALDKRTFESDSLFVGNVATYGEEDHLLLHRVRDAGEWLSVLNWHTGEWRELEDRAAEGLLDTSVMCFLPFGNIVAMMRGSTSAPTNKGLEKWINGLKLFPGSRLVVRPVVSRAEVQRLRTASGASKVEIRIGSHKAAALGQRQGRLARFLRSAREEYGDVNVTMIISVPQGRQRSEDRLRLLNDLRDLEDVMPNAADKAKATLVYAEASGPEYTQLAEFVEHSITAKRRVPAVDDEGNSVKISSAVNIILDVAAQHEDELRLAIDAPQ